MFTQMYICIHTHTRTITHTHTHTITHTHAQLHTHTRTITHTHSLSRNCACNGRGNHRDDNGVDDKDFVVLISYVSILSVQL